MLRKTKIIATLGPATDEDEEIRGLIEAGASVFRLNMSHAKHDWVADVTGRVRKASDALGTRSAILMDLQGPSIRTGVLEEPIQLGVGEKMEIRVEGAEARSPHSTTVNYGGLAADVSAGDKMLVDNGVLHLRVLETNSERITCEVLTSGELGSRRHINLPGVRVNLPPLTEKDLEDVEFGVDLGVDFFAMSFVRDASHVEELRGILRNKECGARIVAKLEDQEAMTKLDDIILASDVVMIARGDLGIEVHVEELPIVQRLIAKRCLTLGRRFILATHLLESMIQSPAPTRAEVTDVANAVFEQADALMLSGETSVGKYPVECAKMLDCIALRIEESGGAGYAETAVLGNAKIKTAKSAVVLANSLENSVILVFTSRGIMANYASHLRPERAPIFAFSPNEAVCRSLLVSRGVHAFHMGFSEDAGETVEGALKILKKRGLVVDGQAVVILSDVLTGEPEVDSILLREA